MKRNFTENNFIKKILMHIIMCFHQIYFKVVYGKDFKVDKKNFNYYYNQILILQKKEFGSILNLEPFYMNKKKSFFPLKILLQMINYQKMALLKSLWVVKNMMVKEKKKKFWNNY